MNNKTLKPKLFEITYSTKYWGYIDMEKNIVTDPKFDYANDFKNGEAKIIIDDQYGIID